jgi:putative isomerase
VALGGYGTAAGSFTAFPYDAELVRLGPRGAHGRYAELELAHAGARLRLRWALVGTDALVAELEVLDAGEWGLRRWHLLALGVPDGVGEASLERPEGAAAYVEPPMALLRVEHGAVALLPARRPVGAALYDDWTEAGRELERAGYYFRPPERAAGRWAVLRANAVEPRLRWALAAAPDEERARRGAREALGSADAALEEGRREAALVAPRRAAVRDVVGWNTVWHPADRRPYTAATRAWVDARFGGAIVWLVDAWVHVLLASHLGDWEAARWNVEAALGNRTDAGALAALRSPLTFWQDRSHPPLGALAVWDLHARTGDRALLERAYPVLLQAHEWWFSHRDPNGDGLLEYGSSPVGDGHFVHTGLAAMDESAMDNSPVHDGAQFDTRAHTLDAADVGLNALVALECELLAGMAAELGRPGTEADLLRERAGALGARVRERLWDPEREVFANRGWDGRFARSLAPTSFYPLLAGIASPEQAGRLVDGHLLDPDRFWTPVPLAGTPADDPAASDNTYWRGRAWPLFNLLVFRGLRRYGFDEAAGALAGRGLEAWEHHWAERRSWENLNQLTGAGGDSPDSDPFYTWGAVLAALPDWDLIDLTPWDGLSFGTPGAATGEAELVTAAGGWTCRVGPGATELAARDGLCLRLALRGRVRDVRRIGGELSLEVPARSGAVPVQVRAPGTAVMEARIAGVPVAVVGAEAGGAALELPAGDAGRLVVRWVPS